MKKLLIFIIFFSAVRNKSTAAETWVPSNQSISIDTLPTQQLITFLQQMDVQSYYGMPVDSFLMAVPANFYNLKVYSSANSKYPDFKASYLKVDFTFGINGPGAIIYVRNFTHMNKYNNTGVWDVNLFRQEKIYRIDVYKDQNTCINGWCLE